MARGHARALVLLAKHQASSLVSTAVDFAVMILAVELFHIKPALATVCGAATGAVANFTLVRHWAFSAGRERPEKQALRYALVSIASLLLNSAGVHLLSGVVGIQYVLARTMVAIFVSIAWNFPLQRHFVFTKGAKT